MGNAVPFLQDRVPRPLTLPGQGGFEPKALYIGNGQNAFEAVVIAAPGEPSGGALQSAWRARRGGRASPVLLVALYGDHTALCGPAGDEPPVRVGVDRGQAERLCRAALDQPDRHTALAFLSQALPSLDTPIPGLRNEGLFALHALTTDAPPETRETLWGFYNAIVRDEDYRPSKKESPDRRADRICFGAGNDLKLKALQAARRQLQIAV